MTRLPILSPLPHRQPVPQSSGQVAFDSHSGSQTSLPQSQVQSQSLISMLTQATAQTAQTQVAAQPVNGAGGAANGAGADRRLPRGSIVNILA